MQYRCLILGWYQIGDVLEHSKLALHILANVYLKKVAHKKDVHLYAFRGLWGKAEA